MLKYSPSSKLHIIYNLFFYVDILKNLSSKWKDVVNTIRSDFAEEIIEGKNIDWKLPIFYPSCKPLNDLEKILVGPLNVNASSHKNKPLIISIQINKKENIRKWLHAGGQSWNVQQTK